MTYGQITERRRGRAAMLARTIAPNLNHYCTTLIRPHVTTGNTRNTMVNKISYGRMRTSESKAATWSRSISSICYCPTQHTIGLASSETTCTTNRTWAAYERVSQKVLRGCTSDLFVIIATQHTARLRTHLPSIWCVKTQRRLAFRR